jgi:hypothetical protein
MKRDWFIGIGVQKCASTWIYDILLDHPQVGVGKRKEIDFFSYNYGLGYQWFESHFPIEDPRRRVWGEISPSYFVGLDIPRRVHDFAPRAKILVSLRDPVERAISNHRHEVRLGNFCGPDLSFEAGLKNNPFYLEQSRYGTHLHRWLERFAPSDVLIVFQEDIVANPGKVAEKIYGFLGIDASHHSVALAGQSNESHVYRFDGIERVRKAAREAVRTLRVDGMWRAAQRGGLQALYRRLNRRPPGVRIPDVGVETRRNLRVLLEDEIRMVEEIAGRSLDHWRHDMAAQQLNSAPVSVQVRPAMVIR